MLGIHEQAGALRALAGAGRLELEEQNQLAATRIRVQHRADSMLPVSNLIAPACVSRRILTRISSRHDYTPAGAQHPRASQNSWTLPLAALGMPDKTSRCSGNLCNIARPSHCTYAQDVENRLVSKS